MLGEVSLAASSTNRSLKGSLSNPSTVISGTNVVDDVKLDGTWEVTIEKQAMSSNNNHVSSYSSFEN